MVELWAVSLVALWAERWVVLTGCKSVVHSVVEWAQLLVVQMVVQMVVCLVEMTVLKLVDLWADWKVVS